MLDLLSAMECLALRSTHACTCCCNVQYIVSEIIYFCIHCCAIQGGRKSKKSHNITWSCIAYFELQSAIFGCHELPSAVMGYRGLTLMTDTPINLTPDPWDLTVYVNTCPRYTTVVLPILAETKCMLEAVRSGRSIHMFSFINKSNYGVALMAEVDR